MGFCHRLSLQHRSAPVNQNNEAGCPAHRPLNNKTSHLFRPPTSMAYSLALSSAESIASHLNWRTIFCKHCFEIPKVLSSSFCTTTQNSSVSARFDESISLASWNSKQKHLFSFLIFIPVQITFSSTQSCNGFQSRQILHPQEHHQELLQAHQR